MGYLEKLDCECIVFGGDAAGLSNEERKTPVIVFADCPTHNPKKK